MAGPDIFVSYTHKDAARAKQVADALGAEGFAVWWDAALRSGETFDEVTEAALREAKAVAVLWSKNSVESRWVRAEATEAEREGKLVPAMIEECKRPIRFELTHTADLSNWRGARSDPLWRTYVEDLRKVVGSAAPEGRPAPQPIAARPRRDRLLAGVVVAALLAMTATAIWLFSDRGQDRAGPSAVAAGERIPVVIRTFATSGSGGQGDSQLAGGITDELVIRLRQLPGLRIGGGSATGGNGVFADAYVVDGTIRRDGERLRITAQLADHNGEVVWSQSYDRNFSDLFAMQEQIATAIADALSVTLDVGSNSSRYGGTDNPAAYAAYLQFKTTQYSYDQSIPLGYLDRAIALDPNYIKALSALADSYGPRIAYAATRPEGERLLSEMDASTAHMIEANPEMWMSHASRAWYFLAAGSFAEATREVDLALRLDRQVDPELPAELATLEISLGRVRKASALMTEAQLIDPAYRNDPRMIRYLVYNGRYQEAVDLFEALARDGNEGRNNHVLEVYWAYLLTGREAQANDLFARTSVGLKTGTFLAERQLPSLSLPGLRAWATARFGDGHQWDLGKWPLQASHHGDLQLAVNLLRLTLERRGPVGGLTMWHPVMAPARKTPEFARLMSDLGLADMWRKSGDWPDFCRPQGANGVICH